jgi:hypothetical protein
VEAAAGATVSDHVAAGAGGLRCGDEAVGFEDQESLAHGAAADEEVIAEGSFGGDGITPQAFGDSRAQEVGELAAFGFRAILFHGGGGSDCAG